VPQSANERKTPQDARKGCLQEGKMKKFAFASLAIAAALAIAPAAMADTVQYSTTVNNETVPPTSQTYTHVFLLGNQNNMELNFTGVSNSVNEPTFATLGNFNITGFWGSDTFTAVPFSLDINQTIPSHGTGDLLSSINGTISDDQSSASITFDETSVQIGSVIYTLTGYTLNGMGLPTYTINANYSTSINAHITETPEPSSLLLMGSGLLGLAMVVFWKAKAARLVLHS
jgi:hypothetical protein